MIKSEVSSIKSWAASKLNWVEENWTEIWFHSVIENNYVETTLATTFLSIPKLFLSNLLKFPWVPEDFKLDAESNKHRLLQQRTTAAAPFYHSCSQLSMGNFRSTEQSVTLDLEKLSGSPLLRARDWIEGVYSNISGDVF